MHHKHMSHCLVDKPYRQAFIVNMTLGGTCIFITTLSHLFIPPTRTLIFPNTNTTNKQRDHYSHFSRRSRLTAEFSVIKKKQKTLMSMIKMTVMRGWDRDMNLTLTRNAKSNSFGFWLWVGACFCVYQPALPFFILFFNSVEQVWRCGWHVGSIYCTAVVVWPH